MATQEEKITAIQHILKAEYNSTRWKTFLSELFTSSNFFSNPTPLLGINSSVASQALQIGSITIIENGISRNIAVYEVTLADNIVLERNRVGLRNLLKPHWKKQDAAFIVYHHPKDKSWRFSYVSELKTFNEAGEYVDNKTEPKRYTYVLGENESCRTAAIQFSKLQDKASNATLDDIKEAFSVEKMSKEFFDTYKDHYQDFVQFLTGKRLEKVSGKWEEVVKHEPNTQLITIFNNNEKDVRDFCKKLLGRIVFLYFIQKKGWLGVPLHDKWGNGKPDFISRLLANCRNPSIFYSEYLSKLFFETLNQPRPDDLAEIIPGEKTRVPYLNGGLFEEDGPNQRGLIFEAELFKDLFAFFDQYNFTIYEDDPNDHTVAVDPEMLGHIFENLLEDNKDKGAFYTPKEIVHYMCQESLIEYLTTWFEGKNYQVQQDTFISFDNAQQTSFLSANESRTGQGVLEIAQTAQSTGKIINRSLIEKLLKKQLSDEDKQAVIEHAAEFNEALDKVKICDPAIGSGAFPMGLLLEIFTAKQTIHTFTHGDLTTFEPAKVKLNIIQNSIYGVDIERGAVDIARLRFWLSLVVDEPEPQPLPNLDYKIVVGNSLISKLGDDVIEIDWDVKKQVTFDMFGADEASKIKQTLTELNQLQKAFFNSQSDKKSLAPKIRNLKIDLLIQQLSLMIETRGLKVAPRKMATQSQKDFVAQTELYLQTQGWLAQVTQLQALKTKPDKTLDFFDWQLNFAEVLNKDVAENENVGFDIVIGNPPYGANIDKEASYYQNKFNKVAKSYLDIYKCFYETCHLILARNGNLALITPNTFISQPRYSDLRSFILNFCILKIHNLGMNVFEAAVVPTAIYFAKNSSPKDSFCYVDSSQNSKFNSLNLDANNSVIKLESVLSSKDISFLNTQNNYELCFDDVFNIKDAGIQYHRSGIGLKNKGGNDLYERLFSSIKNFFQNTTPTLYGKKINTYYIDTDFDEYFNNDYKKILNSNESVSFTLEAFNQVPKILWRQTASKPVATIDYNGYWFRNTIQCCWLKKEFEFIDLEFCLGLINSKFIGYTYNKIVSEAGRVFPQVKIGQVKKLPFVIPTESQIKFIKNRVIVLLEKNEITPNNSLLTEIDLAIYKLYKVSFNEVKLIEPEFTLSEAEYNAIVI